MRLSINVLLADVARLNELVESTPDTPGYFTLSRAYGGYSLHLQAGRGQIDVFARGHMPARQIHDAIHDYRRGICHARWLIAQKGN